MPKEKKDKGRPKEYEEKMIRKGVYLPKRMIERLKQKSEEYNISINKLVRIAIENLFKNYEKIMKESKEKETEEVINWTEKDKETLIKFMELHVEMGGFPKACSDEIKRFFEIYDKNELISAKKEVLKRIVRYLQDRSLTYNFGEHTYYEMFNEISEVKILFEKIGGMIRKSEEKSK